jgi:hypothetical protein
LAFPIFLFAAQPKEIFLDGLKKLEQRSHKCVELRGEYVEQIHFFNPVACCFFYKAKDLSASPWYHSNAEDRRLPSLFIFFDHDDGGRYVPPNACELVPGYTALCPKRWSPN